MEEIKFCPHCGQANKGSSNYCEHCGKPLDLNEEVKEMPNLSSFEDANNFFDNQINHESPTNEAPIVEKSQYTTLNYSQALRRALFVNPVPLYSGLFFILILIGEIMISYFSSSEIPSTFYLGLVFIGLDLVYLFMYLIVQPLKSLSMAKHSDVHDYRVSFFKDKLHYQLNLNYRGQELRNDFFLRYIDLFKYKEYKDMMILGFVVQGQLVPLCLVKDEYYDRVISLLQNRLDEISTKKKF